MLGHLLECVLLASVALSSTLGLVGSLLRLQFFQGSFSLCGTDLTLLGSLLLNLVQRRTNDGSLYLAGTGSLLLGGRLGDSLLVQTTPSLCPYQFGGLLTLKGKTVGLGGPQPDGLAITTDHEFPISGVNTVLRKSTEFSCQREKN